MSVRDGERDLDLLAETARVLITSGAEVYHVRSELRALARSLGVGEVEAFIVPTGVMITVRCADGVSRSKVVEARRRAVDLSRVDRVYGLVDSVLKEGCAPESLAARLRALKASPFPYPPWMVVLAGGVSALFLTAFFGGSGGAALGAGFLGGMAAQGIFMLLMRLIGIRFVSVFFGSAVGALAGQMARSDAVTISVILVLIPCLAVVSSLRDFIFEDYLSGVARAAEALLVGSGIAGGVSLVLLLFGAAGGS